MILRGQKSDRKLKFTVRSQILFIIKIANLTSDNKMVSLLTSI